MITVLSLRNHNTVVTGREVTKTRLRQCKSLLIICREIIQKVIKTIFYLVWMPSVWYIVSVSVVRQPLIMYDIKAKECSDCYLCNSNHLEHLMMFNQRDHKVAVTTKLRDELLNSIMYVVLSRLKLNPILIHKSPGHLSTWWPFGCKGVRVAELIKYLLTH